MNQQLVELIPSSQRDRIEPPEEDIIFYGRVIGLDFEGEDAHLKWIGKCAIQADLPPDWRIFQTPDLKIVYQNIFT